MFDPHARMKELDEQFDYHCLKCHGITKDSNYCDNPECPNMPCCGKPREECTCDEEKVENKSNKYEE